MDPDANLAEQRLIISRIINADGVYGQTVSERIDIARLADLVDAMDGWISNGGFLPKVWQRPLRLPATRP